MKTMISIKINNDLKEKAQKTAKSLGLPLSMIVNNYLEEFVLEKRVVFTEHPTPNKRTAKILDAIRKDIKNGKNIVSGFTTVEDFKKSLLS